MHRSNTPDDTGVVSMDRASAAGQKTFVGAGYRLAAGGLGRRWTPSGDTAEDPCLEDEFVAHTARAWTRLRAVAARVPHAARAGVSAASVQADRVSMVAVCQATALCALAAIGASAALYWQKSRTARVDHEIGHVVGEMASAHAQTGQLRAQWLALNDPARLQDAAARYSGLRPLAPAQFVDSGKLTDHLPAPGAVPADTGVDTAPDAAVAGDAMPVFKPVTAQAASMMVPAVPAQLAVQAATVSQVTSAGPPVSPATAEPAGANAETANADMASVKPRAFAGPRTARAQPASGDGPSAHRPARALAQDDVWDAPVAVAAHPHAAAPTRLAAAVAHAPLRLAAPAVVHAAGNAVRVAPPVAHAETRPHVVPRMLMARFDMPHWLLQAHAPRPAPVIMSAPAHALSVPHDTSVLQPARHGGEPALSVKSEDRAYDDTETSEPQAAEEPRPAPMLRRPGYRPYYGYGGPYGYPDQSAPPRYYTNPYGGYGSQPYGAPYGTYYQ